MYLSKLILNPTLLKTRQVLISPYTLHQAVFRALPDASDGGPGRVLYRLDEDKSSGNAYLLVQSEKQPRWDRAEVLADCFGEPPKSKIFTPQVRRGQLLYFRLRANPTMKRNRGKRLGLLREEAQLSWLKGKAAASGFSIISCTVIPEGILTAKKQDSEGCKREMSFFSVRFEGLLRVEEPEAFLKSLRTGIGSGKGMGFGLLSVAPARS
jgi:CRISPR system Cascade subunit CasE